MSRVAFDRPHARLRAVSPDLQRYGFELEQQEHARGGSSSCWDRGRKAKRAQKLARLAQEKAEFHQH